MSRVVQFNSNGHKLTLKLTDAGLTANRTVVIPDASFTLGEGGGGGTGPGGDLVWPSTDGLAGQVLATNGAGEIYWKTDAVGSGGGIQLPADAGTAGQVLATNGLGGIYWKNDATGEGGSPDPVVLALADLSDVPSYAGQGGKFLAIKADATGVEYVTAPTGGGGGSVSFPITVAQGGTNATTAGQARTNLGLGSLAEQAGNAVNILGGAINGTVIGGVSAADGTFSNLVVTGTATISGVTLPSSGGTAGQSLISNGDGTVTWGTPSVDIEDGFVMIEEGPYLPASGYAPAEATGESAVAIGPGTKAGGQYDIVIGVANSTLPGVAVGRPTVLVGGIDNAAGTSRGVTMVGGYGNSTQDTHDGVFVGGIANRAAVFGVVVGGENIVATNKGVVIGGDTSLGTSQGVVLGGQKCVSDNAFAVATGAFAKPPTSYALAIGAPLVGVSDDRTDHAGLAQSVQRVMTAITSSNSVTALSPNPSLLGHQTLLFECFVVARNVAPGGDSPTEQAEVAAFKLSGIASRPWSQYDGATFLALDKEVIYRSVAAWDVTVDTAGQGQYGDIHKLQFNVVGEVGKTIRWVATLRTTEVIA